MFAFPGENDDTHLLVRRCTPHRGVEAVQHCVVLRVGNLGPVKPDPRYGAFCFYENRVFTHASLPYSIYNALASPQRAILAISSTTSSVTRLKMTEVMPESAHAFQRCLMRSGGPTRHPSSTYSSGTAAFASSLRP